MQDYEAPSITSRNDLRGNLGAFVSNPVSDAQIKHGVETVSDTEVGRQASDYQAPAIVEHRPLEGALGAFNSIPA